ncbi:ArnT family glycosyltransferase [Nitrospina gracilis]|uniref:ArnT family glycosyltransferase n=1 Tax=Nitrospina gracilis TaxID=35801 RepID=UPI001F2F82B2|nr:glycosyltransferase family 39 protein [Nitrospina gracilis]MCF8719486.1 4-amino-4-deoxy-L-arabinose transferase-like glycosyltransferase [Nitrospina gracilis Nb-211]
MQNSQPQGKTDTEPSHCAAWWTLGVLALVLICRGAAAAVVPIMDETEARYAEIARKMVETGDWIMPQFDYGVPFWGKPPLSTWLSATGIALFGAGELGPRLPILILSAALLVLFWRFVKENEGSFTAHLATILLATSAIFLAAAGAVMTDMVLMFSLFVMMSACWRFTREWNPAHARWMFAGIGIGLLTKGLMVFAVGGLPIAVWLILTKKWKPFLKKLPWGTGLFITAVIAVPWYVAAEVRTPGFLHYFFIGEHFNRFLVPGWEGDRYGFAHAQPFGMIWGFYLLGLAPWIVLVPAACLLTLRKPEWMNFKDTGPQREWVLFLLCWVVVPALFLTFARNIIWTYSLPAAPPAAILLALSLRNVPDPSRILRHVHVATAVMMLGMMSYIFYAADKDASWPLPTHKGVVAEYHRVCEGNPDCRLWVFGERSFSAEYYMKGKARRTERVNFLLHDARGKKRDYLAARDHLLDRLHPSEKNHLQPVARFGDLVLWRVER